MRTEIEHAVDEKSFQEREAELLRELSALYTKLNQVREKRAKAELETTSSTADSSSLSRQRHRRRVLLVTRTLPFTLIAEDAQSQWRAEFPENVSLDAALETYLCLHETYDCVWIGSVHGEVEPSEQNTLKEQLLQDRNYFPVFLDPKREKLFYQGFCKSELAMETLIALYALGDALVITPVRDGMNTIPFDSLGALILWVV
ncbi:hypothetical protein ATCC90586_008459 [Pythium insidiosum]|nr:hypothetical protein ATCC90586_008459 [Pythium insidiosum]